MMNLLRHEPKHSIVYVDYIETQQAENKVLVRLECYEAAVVYAVGFDLSYGACFLNRWDEW